VHILSKNLKQFAAVAALGAIVLAGAVPAAYAQAAAGTKNWKDRAEYDLYVEVGKDISANNFAKALTDLDAWKSKYAQTDYASQRTVLYAQAYNGAKQPAKALEIAAEILDKDLTAAFPTPAEARDALTLLFTSTVAIQQIPDPTPAQIATGEKAAKMLLTFDRKPEGTDDAAWNSAKPQLQNAAKQGLLFTSVIPGNQALAKKDCDTAVSVYTKALTDNPDNAFIAYSLGQAYNCVRQKDPSKTDEAYPKAIYEFVRAMVIDPSLGGTQDGKKITDSITKIYTNYHGSEDGLDQLKQQAKASPLPPAGFVIESATVAANRKQKEFESKYPQLALWLGIKSQLASPQGEAYFSGQLKDAAVPKLKGMVVEGKPACRSKEILVSVPEPDEKGTPQSVISLKLDTALTGKPEPGEIQFEGVPTGFKPDPFMLTMDTEKAKIEGLKVSACSAAPAGRSGAGAKKAAPKKKK
jgi:hypothetical protein